MSSSYRRARNRRRTTGHGPKGPRVVRVLSANEIELDGGQIVRLLGVSPFRSRQQEAIDFLKELFCKEQVVLKFEEMKYDDQGRLLAYVFLENKTFVNGHLLRQGLAKLDTSLHLSREQSLRRFALKNGRAHAD